jgi:hypothetical protein
LRDVMGPSLRWGDKIRSSAIGVTPKRYTHKTNLLKIFVLFV